MRIESDIVLSVKRLIQWYKTLLTYLIKKQDVCYRNHVV